MTKNLDKVIKDQQQEIEGLKEILKDLSKKNHDMNLFIDSIKDDISEEYRKCHQWEYRLKECKEWIDSNWDAIYIVILIAAVVLFTPLLILAVIKWFLFTFSMFFGPLTGLTTQTCGFIFVAAVAFIIGFILGEN